MRKSNTDNFVTHYNATIFNTNLSLRKPAIFYRWIITKILEMLT